MVQDPLEIRRLVCWEDSLLVIGKEVKPESTRIWISSSSRKPQLQQYHDVYDIARNDEENPNAICSFNHKYVVSPPLVVQQ